MHHEHCGICIFSNWCFHVSSIYTAVELVDHMAGPGAFLGGTMVKNPPANVEDGRDVGLIPGSGRSLEKEMATHSSILAWKIPWTEEPDWFQPMGSQRIGHD